MFKKVFNSKGFGLVEVIIAAGLAAGLALVVAQQGKEMTRITKSTEANVEINAFIQDISYILSDKDSCNATIAPGTTFPTDISSIQRVPMPSATPSPAETVYEVGEKYGNGSFTFKKMTLDKNGGDVFVDLVMTRESGLTYGARDVQKRIPLQTVLDAAGTAIVSCFSDVESIITSAVQQACTGNSARFDPVTRECVHNVGTNPCTPDQILRRIETSGGQVVQVCTNVLPADTNCPAGQFIRNLDVNGAATCAGVDTSNPRCTAGQYAYGLADGQILCRDLPKCGPDQIIRASATGVLSCQTLGCATANQYFAGFNMFGNPVCKNFPDETCGAGRYVKEIRPNGSVVCEQVPNHLSLPVQHYSFVDGFDAVNHVWSRKSIDQVAEQICDRILDYSWNGNKCVPVGSSPWTYTSNSATLTLNGAKYTFTDGPVFSIAPNGLPPTIAMRGQNAWWHNNGGVIDLTQRGTSAVGSVATGARLSYKGVNGYGYESMTDLQGDLQITRPSAGIIFNPSITTGNNIEMTRHAACGDPDKGRFRIARRNGTSKWAFFACLNTVSQSSWRWEILKIE